MKKLLTAMLLVLSLTAAAQQISSNATELWIENGQRRIFGELFTPSTGSAQKPIAIISHGFNGSHEYGRN